MAYTFGAATGDDINWAAINTAGAGSRTQVVCGWWYPTTLTATRGLWSFGNVFGAEIDTTTSELRLRTDNTTDGQWTTSGVGLVTGSWKFLAFYSSTNNTGPAGAWRVWAGDVDTVPTEVTVSVATSPVGNFTGSTAFTIGNKGTGTVAFQGDVGEVCYYLGGSTASATVHPFGHAAFGTITQAEADLVLDRFVMPAYRGDTWSRTAQDWGGQIGVECGYWSGKILGRALITAFNTANSIAGMSPTINGATYSEQHPPSPPNQYIPARVLLRR